MIDFQAIRTWRRQPRFALLAVLCLSVAADLAAQGYGGPSILSRGGNRPGRRGRAPVDFTFYGGVRGTADQGLLGGTLEDGTVKPVDTYGGSAEIGLYGGHDWRRSSFGVDYRGDYRYNSRFKQFNGLNQAISLEYQQQLSRRFSFGLRETGGMTNRAFAGFAAPALADIGRPGVPLNEVFDVRTYYNQTGGWLAWRKSARMTAVVQGQGFFVKRQNASLINGQGYQGTGQILYRTSRRTEWGAQYQFLHLEFPRVYGGSDNHSVAGVLNRQFGRNWDLNVTAGVFRSTAYGTQQVKLSPEVAFILGRTTGFEAFRITRYLPQIDATASYTLQRSRFTASAQSGVANGNGVYLTTSRKAVQLGYSYSGIRRWSLGASAGYSRNDGLGLRLGNLTIFQSGGGASYKIAEHLDFSAQLDYRYFDSPGVQGRRGYSASVGLTYSTSRLPISIW